MFHKIIFTNLSEYNVVRSSTRDGSQLSAATKCNTLSFYILLYDMNVIGSVDVSLSSVTGLDNISLSRNHCQFHS